MSILVFHYINTIFVLFSVCLINFLSVNMRYAVRRGGGVPGNYVLRRFPMGNERGLEEDYSREGATEEV